MANSHAELCDSPPCPDDEGGSQLILVIVDGVPLISVWWDTFATVELVNQERIFSSCVGLVHYLAARLLKAIGEGQLCFPAQPLPRSYLWDDLPNLIERH